MPEHDEGEGGGEGNDSVPDRCESLVFVTCGTVHRCGSPIIHSEKDGFRRPLPSPELATGGDDGFELLSHALVELVERPGVSRPLTTTSTSVAPACLPLSFVQLPAVPFDLRSFAVGVGRCPRFARRAIWIEAAGVASIGGDVEIPFVESMPDLAIVQSDGRFALGRSNSPPIPLIPFCDDP